MKTYLYTVALEKQLFGFVPTWLYPWTGEITTSDAATVAENIALENEGRLVSHEIKDGLLMMLVERDS